MHNAKTYKTNRILAFVVIIMGFAILFSIDIDRLLVFYKEIWSVVIVTFFAVINPLLILFGFSFRITPGEVVGKSYFFVNKRFKVGDLSHILYQPTWRGVTPENSATNMRSLHIVRHSGGWSDTISLANGAYNEEDLADIAKRLRQINSRIQFDDQANALIKKYS